MFAATPKTPPPSQASQTMSQSEVERLLALVGSGDLTGGEATGSGSQPPSGQSLVLRHEFPQASSFSSDEMRKLRLRCDAFVRALAARLTFHLGLECGVQLTKLETVRFEQFTGALSNPTHLALFHLEPMRGLCLLDVPPRLALAIVDRELGGPAAAGDEVRDLTQIEAKLAAKVLTLMMTEWCAAWSDALPLRPVLLRHETSGRYVQPPAQGATMLTLGLETRVAQITELIQIAIPQLTLEPLMQKLNADLKESEKPETAESRGPVQWNPAMNDVPVKATVHWHGLDLSAREILALRPGDVVPLGPATTSQAELRLDAAPKFTGQIGTSGRHLALKIIGTV